MSFPALYLLHTRPDPRRLASWAARHGLLPTTQGDLGYALHGLLRAAFGDAAPQPFFYDNAERGLLAYTRLGPDEMMRNVALADPDAAETLGLCTSANDGGYRLRPFPSKWQVGHMLHFTVRVRPVVRDNKSGKECDAFLAAAKRAPDIVLHRESVYRQWLHDQLAVRENGKREPWQGAIDIVDASLTRFRLLQVLRQTQREESEARNKRAVGGPDAVLSGRLRIIDPLAFSYLLARGVGRHRAFGFGMLLLQPAR